MRERSRVRDKPVRLHQGITSSCCRAPPRPAPSRRQPTRAGRCLQQGGGSNAGMVGKCSGSVSTTPTASHGAAAGRRAHVQAGCSRQGCTLLLLQRSHFSGSHGSLGCLASWCICAWEMQRYSRESKPTRRESPGGGRCSAVAPIGLRSSLLAIRLCSANPAGHPTWPPTRLHGLQVRRRLCADVAPAGRGGHSSSCARHAAHSPRLQQASRHAPHRRRLQCQPEKPAGLHSTELRPAAASIM